MNDKLKSVVRCMDLSRSVIGSGALSLTMLFSDFDVFGSWPGRIRCIPDVLVSVPAGIERTFPAAGMRFWNLVIPLVLPGW
jgi:hypothetical protein